MATNQNNIHVNSFTKGMNSDTSVDMIGNDQYMFGMNIRITTNALLKAVADSNSREGIVAPVPAGKIVDTEGMYDTSNYRILAVGSIENIGYVIIADDEKESAIWHIYKLIFDEKNDIIHYSLQFTSNVTTNKKKFSTVIIKEAQDLIKIYIADGEHQIMQLNLIDDEYNNKISGNIDNIMSNRIFPGQKIQVLNVVSGQLPTSQVQYAYRLYKKHGVVSKLSPLTNKIQVIDKNKNKENGNAEDTKTSVGLQLRIPLERVSETFNDIYSIFDSIQVFRLTYKKINQQADVDIIYDSNINDKDVVIIDSGTTSLQTLSIDEFSALNKLVLIPQTIEKNQNYLFLGNVTDDTTLRMTEQDKESNIYGIDSIAYSHNQAGVFILYSDQLYQDYMYCTDISEIQPKYYINRSSDINKAFDPGSNEGRGQFRTEDRHFYYGGAGKNVTYDIVTAKIPIDNVYIPLQKSTPNVVESENMVSDIKRLYHIKGEDASGDSDYDDSISNTNEYLTQSGICCSNLSYDDMITSSMFRSLRRDEVYRYGIVYYDKYGKRSNVQWIADIRTPNLERSPNVYINSNGTNTDATTNYNTVVSTPIRTYNRLRCQTKPEFNITVDGRIYTRYLSADSSVSVGSVMNIRDERFLIETISTKMQTSYTISSITAVYKWEIDSQRSDVSYSLLSRLVSSNNEEYKINIIKKDLVIGVESAYELGSKINITNPSELYLQIIYLFERTQYIYKPSEVGFREYNSSFFGYELTFQLGYNINVYVSHDYDNDIQQPNGISNGLIAQPLGIRFNVSIPETNNIKYFQIVRCEKSDNYSRILLQCALSKPIYQRYSTTNSNSESLKSPLYPQVFLSDFPIQVPLYLQNDESTYVTSYDLDNPVLLALSPFISLYKEDALQKLSYGDSKLRMVGYAYESDLEDMSYVYSGHTEKQDVFTYENDDYGIGIMYTRWNATGSGTDALEFKPNGCCVAHYYNIENRSYDKNISFCSNIEDVAESNNIPPEDGFTNIQLSGSVITTGVQSYKSYTSIVKNDEYVNWVCNGMYNLRITEKQSQKYVTSKDLKVYTYDDSDNKYSKERHRFSNGYIGPGPNCLLLKLNSKEDNFFNYIASTKHGYVTTGCKIANVEHTAQQFAGITKNEHKLDVYYGFGNFFELKPDGNGNVVGSGIVFDGDIYNLPCELPSLYKTYDFNSVYDSLPSTQIVNYVPLESTINTYFNYGMNYRNTQNSNMQIEPCSITGVSSQTRPSDQYNSIYSDNKSSNDVYFQDYEEDDVYTYNQRIFYSSIKTNGEQLESWTQYNALDYIDVDSSYGDITHLLTNKDVLYFWQTSAFGKLSVNERSLVTDNNNNTIQLGQGGVLQRSDYLDTLHGMRKEDHSAIGISTDVYWIDYYNKSIMKGSTNGVVNYGESLNVQNILNDMQEYTPMIHYDNQNQELLCKCLQDGKQLVFNIKVNIATSVYTRDYDDMILFNNVLYGLSKHEVRKHSFIKNENNDNLEFLIPTILQFSVNSNASITKTFDNQQIVMLSYNNNENIAETFAKDKLLQFDTNLDNSSYDHDTKEIITDREGNIQYAIPRSNNSEYGNRLKGKWMKVTIEDENPKYNNTISHILTKFRQSFI